MPVREGGIGWSPDYKSEDPKRTAQLVTEVGRIKELYQALVAMLNEHGCVDVCPACDNARKVLE
jgi:hypothetical protein